MALTLDELTSAIVKTQEEAVSVTLETINNKQYVVSRVYRPTTTGVEIDTCTYPTITAPAVCDTVVSYLDPFMVYIIYKLRGIEDSIAKNLTLEYFNTVTIAYSSVADNMLRNKLYSWYFSSIVEHILYTKRGTYIANKIQDICTVIPVDIKKARECWDKLHELTALILVWLMCNL